MRMRRVGSENLHFFAGLFLGWELQWLMAFVYYLDHNSCPKPSINETRRESLKFKFKAAMKERWANFRLCFSSHPRQSLL